MDSAQYFAPESSFIGVAQAPPIVPQLINCHCHPGLNQTLVRRVPLGVPPIGSFRYL